MSEHGIGKFTAFSETRLKLVMQHRLENEIQQVEKILVKMS